MNTQNVKQIVQKLCREVLELDNETPVMDNGELTEDVISFVALMGRLIHENMNIKTVHKIRDKELGITEQDYIDWCLEELAIWANEQTENK